MTHQDVKLFTRSDCRDSPRVRAWLEDRNIPFVERVVDDDPIAAKELQETGLFVTPLLLSDNTRVIGYRPQRLKEMFGIDE